MFLIKRLFWSFYRIWFYILVTLPIIILFPLLFISILREKWYSLFFKLARFWAKFILIGMGFRWKIRRLQALEKGKSYMFIANHTSMIDIMLMLICVKDNPFVFVGKKELAKIPLFGFFYKRTCILVDRSNPESRKAVFLRARKRLESGLSICIFPEAGIPDKSILLDEFKDGAFRLAINHQIPIVPFTFLDNKKRFSYIFFSGSPGKMRAIIHPSINTKGLEIEDTSRVNKVSRNILLTTLRENIKQ